MMNTLNCLSREIKSFSWCWSQWISSGLLITPGSYSGLGLQWEGRGQPELGLELLNTMAGTGESSGWSYRAVEWWGGRRKLTSLLFFASVFHTFYCTDWQNMVLRKRHTSSTDHWFPGSSVWRSCFLLPSLLWKHSSKREGNYTEKGKRAHLMWSPGGKPVASIRTWERLSALSKMLCRKSMEKVIWSVCKNSSPFPPSSHSFTVCMLTSGDTLVQRWQQEMEQCGWEALREAELSSSLMSVGFPAHLHLWEVGAAVWVPLQPPLHLLDTHISSKGSYVKAKELKKASAGQFEFEKVWNGGSGTNTRGFSQCYFSMYLKLVI